MADPRVRIVVEAATQAAERQLRKLQGTVEETGKNAQKSGRMFDSFQSAIVGIGAAVGVAAAAFGTLKKAYDFGKEGAAIHQTKESFEELMDSMGVAPTILQKMRDASLGTVDDMTIMSSTMTLLAGTSDELGLAIMDAAPELMKIAKAAHKLNPALGETDFLYQSLATGIKRSSPLILDNLGLTIKVGDANEAYADSIGKTVDQLTAEETKIALLNAALEAGGVIIDQVGGEVDEMGDSFAQLETTWKNLTDSLKERSAPVAKEVVQFLNDMIDGMERTTATAEAVRKSAVSYEAYLETVLLVAEANHQLSKSDIEVIRRQAEAGEQFHRTVIDMGILTEAQYNAAKETDRISEKWQAYADALKADARPATEDMGKALETTATASFRMADGAETAAYQIRAAAEASEAFDASLDLLHEAITGEFGEDFREYANNIGTMTGELESLRAKEEELSRQPLVTDSQRDRLTDLRGDIADATGELEEAKVAYAKLVEEGADEEKLAKAQEQIDKWQTKIGELNTTVGRTWRDISSTTAEELAEVQASIEETTAALDAESDAFLRNTQETLYNIAEKQILDALEKGLIEDVNNSGTAYDEATTALWTLAERMGLVDDATLTLMEATQDATQAFIDGKVEAGQLGSNLSDLAGAALDADGNINTLRSRIDGLQSKSITIDVFTKYTSEGTPPGVGYGAYTEPGRLGGEARQHGGPVRAGAGYLVGEAGPEYFVPNQSGYIVPNSTTNNNYNLTIHTAAQAESALTDFHIMRALAGVS